MGKLTTVILFGIRGDLQVWFRYEELGGVELPPLPIPGTLVFANPYDLRNGSNVLDAFLRSCRPRTLSIKPPFSINQMFIKYLFEALMSRKQDAECCVGKEIKSWKHYVKDVEAFCNDSPIQQLPTVEDACIRFDLKW